MKRLIYGIAISTLFTVGCGSDNESAVKAEQTSMAQTGQSANGSETAAPDDSSASSAGQANESSESNGNNGSEQLTPTAKPQACPNGCPNGQACIDGTCKTPTNDCQNTCDDSHVCIDGVCIAKSEPEHAKTCTDDSSCDNGHTCVDGECVLSAQEKTCSPECNAGFSCVDGNCVANTASDNPGKMNCNKDVACDPTAVCVSDYYCVELCGEGSDIYNKIDIIDEFGVSQGIEAAKPGFELLKDKESLDVFISKNYLPALDGIDFSKEAVLAITSGESGMGVHFKLLNACDISSTSTLTAFKYYCSTDPMPDALEWQWIMVRVPKDGNYDVKFETNDHFCVKP